MVSISKWLESKDARTKRYAKELKGLRSDLEGARKNLDKAKMKSERLKSKFINMDPDSEKWQKTRKDVDRLKAKVSDERRRVNDLEERADKLLDWLRRKGTTE